MDSQEALAGRAPLLMGGVGLSAFTSGKSTLESTLDRLLRLITS